MLCPGCQQEIEPDARFCGQCGTRVTMRCPGCGAETAADDRFCRSCGRALGAEAQAGAERRQLTVMFCDLVESAVLGERLDPEDFRDVVGSYHRTCARIVERYQGRVAQYLGDGVLSYFAHPQAHEDDAERAIRAGLDILAEIADANPALERERGVRLCLRIGIHTGPVLMSRLGQAQEGESFALGHTVNLASRLQGVAEPDTLLISGDTARLVRGLFVTQPHGPHSLAGIAEPVRSHRVLQPSGVRSRLDVAVAAGLTPLVGRERDLALLLERWDDAREGQGNTVLVEGEAGIGKSRLIHALRDRLGDEAHTWLECHGSAFHENSELYPVRELLRQGLRLSEDQSDDAKLSRVTAALQRAGLHVGEILPLFCELLDLPLPAGHDRAARSAEAERQKTLDALAQWLFTLARLQPAVLVVEDLHWVDPSSLELLGRLVERVPTVPLLLVATYRPTFEPPWGEEPGLVQTTVEPLTRRQTGAMVEAMPGHDVLPKELVGEIVRRTDGVPLFVEELVKSLVEQSDGELRPSIPATLRDSLTARLDRLGPAKDVAQLAAVLGRDFSYELLAAVAVGDPAALDRGLAQLLDAELVYERKNGAGRAFTFKHALIQEAAYQSLLKATRRGRHAHISRVLEQQFAALVKSRPEEVARHCEHGGRTEAALAYYEQAGELAARRMANGEAIGHLKRALALLRELPPGPGRDERELRLHVAIGSRLLAAHGWGSPEAEEVYARARTLCERIGDRPELFQVIRGLVTFYVSRAELANGLPLAKRLLQLAEHSGRASERVVAHHQLAVALYFMGDPAASLEHYETALGLYDPSDPEALRFQYEGDMSIDMRIWMAWALWVNGKPDRARDVAHQAIALGRSIGHPFSLAYALLWASVVHHMRRERDQTQKLAEDAMEVADEHGFGFVHGGARLLRGWALFDPERPHETIEETLSEQMAAARELVNAGSRATIPHNLSSLADVFRQVGRLEPARKTLENAKAFAREHQTPFWDAELDRIEGELVLDEDPTARERAERLFLRAVELARSQQAGSLELRAATSLARLYQKLGRADEARDQLERVYARFTEGFDAPDLVDARSLLTEL